MKGVSNWFDVRDYFVGSDYNEQNIEKAFALAQSALHCMKSQWLLSIFSGKPPSKEIAKTVLQEMKTNGLALGLAALCNGHDDELLQTALRCEDSFAYFLIAKQSSRLVMFCFAQKAAEKGDRDGHYLFGFCLKNNIGCNGDFEKAKEQFRAAAQLGHKYAAHQLASMFPKDTIERYQWLCCSNLDVTVSQMILDEILEQVGIFRKTQTRRNIVAFLGKCLKGKISETSGTIFSSNYKFDHVVKAATFCVNLYNQYVCLCRCTILAWSCCALRLGLCLDVRMLIAKLICAASWDDLFKNLV